MLRQARRILSQFLSVGTFLLVFHQMLCYFVLIVFSWLVPQSRRFGVASVLQYDMISCVSVFGL